MQEIQDTIAAIATAPGAAGLAVVRVSGPAAVAVADAVFRGRVHLADCPSHTLHHGWAEWPGVAGARSGPRLDEVVAAIFRAPRSYTREDIVELSCHGGASAGKLLEALISAGARLAGPGEFTLRAFLSGRLDLAQAEAVADVIRAETEGARVLALGQLAGGLSRRLAALREPVEELLAEVEARVDFAEDVGGIEIPPGAVAGIEAADRDLAGLLEGAAFGRAVREGVRVPLVGTPNAGKSSLFNALVGEERAIVAAEPGTTRDRVSEPVEIAGVRVVLSDTAGLRDLAGEIEAVGVERSRALLAESPRVVWVVDAARPLDSADRAVAASLASGTAGAAGGGGSPTARRVLVALNKSDLPAQVGSDELSALLGSAERRFVRVSALTGAGLGDLRSGLGELAGAGDGAREAAVSNARHVEALGRARAALGRAADAARSGEPGEIVALELRESLAAVGEVTGHAVGDDLLERIFARFCVGK